MHIEFTIPIWVLLMLGYYYVFGLAAAPVFAILQRHYISPKQNPLDVLSGLRWRHYPLVAAFWPLVVWEYVHDVRRYGWKGF